MLFKVVAIKTDTAKNDEIIYEDTVYPVFAVSDASFLIHSGARWTWVNMSWFQPLEQNSQLTYNSTLDRYE
jgi:hypothetical protein